MRVDEIMTRGVISLTPNDTVADAYTHFRSKNIHHLLVIDGGSVVGVVSIRNISGKRDDIPISAVMTRDIKVADSSVSIKEAAAMMMGRNSGCLPIFDNGRLTGIVTTTDLLRVLSRSGAPRPAIA